MNKAFLTIGIILMAIIGFYTVSVISGQQTGSELDYYLLKETTEASMNDAMDSYFYRETGEMRMDKEKFLESFVKRFGTNVDGTREYKIYVYDINETPPKVSIRVTSPKKMDTIRAIGDNGSTETKVDITSTVDMLIETKYKNNVGVENQNRAGISNLRKAGIHSVNGIDIDK